MKVSPTAQSSSSISVTWTYDSGDEIPEFVTINEYGPDGRLLASQPNLPALGGVALFTRLSPNTPYRYQWRGAFPSNSRGAANFVCQDPADAAQVLTLAQKPAPPPPPPTPSPGKDASPVTNIQARALPFGKIKVSWDPAVITTRGCLYIGSKPISISSLHRF